MSDNQKYLESLSSVIENYSRDQFEAGLPYNDAKKLAGNYDEFVECIDLIEKVGHELGISDAALSTLRVTYETLFYPHQYDYIIRNGQKLPVIPPQNASNEADDGLYPLVVNGITHRLDLGEYTVAEDGVYYVDPDGKPVQISEQPVVPFAVSQSEDGMESVSLWCLVYGEEKIITLPKSVAYTKKV